MTQNQDKKGFTIIEVVLVLAIAGLIFLIVFLAVPALQRSQRDTQRRNDLGRFMSQVAQYQSNNAGQVPTAATSGNGSVTQFRNQYLTNNNQSFNDPTTGNVYGMNVTNENAGVGQIYYQTSARCNGQNVEALSGAQSQTRSIAASMALEGGGRACQDNS